MRYYSIRMDRTTAGYVRPPAHRKDFAVTELAELHRRLARI